MSREADTVLGRVRLLGLVRLRARWLLGGAIGLLALGYMALTFEWAQIAGVLARTDLGLLLVGGFGSILLIWLARTARWRGLLLGLGITTSFGKLYICTALALGLSALTPAQSGELLKLRLVRHHAPVDLARGLATFGAERVADLLVLAVLALVSLPVQAGLSTAPWLLVAVVLAIVVGAVALQRVSDLGWVPARLQPLVTALNSCAGTWTAKVGVLGWTLTCWLATAVGWQLCLRSIGVELGFMQTVALVCGVTLITVLSLIPGGLGASEVGAVAMLVQFDVPTAEVQAAAVILRVYGLMVVLLSLVHIPFAPAWRRAAERQLAP